MIRYTPLCLVKRLILVAGAESVWCLYSCSGDGVIFEHIPGRLDKEAVNINNLIQRTNHMKVPSAENIFDLAFMVSRFNIKH